MMILKLNQEKLTNWLTLFKKLILFFFYGINNIIQNYMTDLQNQINDRYGEVLDDVGQLDQDKSHRSSCKLLIRY